MRNGNGWSLAGSLFRADEGGHMITAFLVPPEGEVDPRSGSGGGPLYLRSGDR
jgi:hypothetical protein